MDQHARPTLSRRSLLYRATAMGTVALTAGAIPLGAPATEAASSPASTGADLQPIDAVQTIFNAMGRYPLVAIAERHMLQECHDFLTALLLHPALPRTLTDIVVEFGTAAYQDLTDRFILGDQPVARADLVQIWRQVGDPAWNAPVYEQFFRTVRAVNWRRPSARRIRVLLGQPPVTMSQVVAHPNDRRAIAALAQPMDDHFAAVIEREVLNKGRRALLIAGDGHLLRGLSKDGDPHSLNAVTQLMKHHPGTLFVVDPLILPPGPAIDDTMRRLQANLAGWPLPALALLRGTWLGATTQQLSNAWINWGAGRAINAAAARYDTQADAVLYLGPGEVLTASQTDPEIYHYGAYVQQLRQASAIAGAGNQVAYGLRWAQAGPSWFSLFGQ